MYNNLLNTNFRFVKSLIKILNKENSKSNLELLVKVDVTYN